MTDCVLVLDLGTSSCKGALYSRAGERLALTAEEYPVAHPLPAWSEQNPEDYWRAACAVIERLRCDQVRAIGFSTQTPTLVLMDEQGQALGPAILWQDSRAGEEATELLGIAERVEWFGMDLPIGAAALPPKLLWVARHDRERWAKTRWVVQPKDYVSSRLTGRMMADRWCAKGIAHLGSGEMHADWLALLGKSTSVCPTVGTIRKVVGEWNGVPVINGWSDAMCAILATGAMHIEGRGFVLTGTSEIVGMSRQGSDVAKGLFWVPPDVLEVPALSLHYGPTQAGGSCLQWMAGVLGRTVEETVALVTNAELGSVRFKPYLQGERAPFWDHTLTASFEGLRAQHTAADLVKAVLQGVAEHERLVLETAERGASITDVVLAGGAARNAVWNAIRAKVLGRKVLVMPDGEASLRGAAMLAWSALDPELLFEPWYNAALLEVGA